MREILPKQDIKHQAPASNVENKVDSGNHWFSPAYLATIWAKRPARLAALLGFVIISTFLIYVFASGQETNLIDLSTGTLTNTVYSGGKVTLSTVLLTSTKLIWTHDIFEVTTLRPVDMNSRYGENYPLIISTPNDPDLPSTPDGNVQMIARLNIRDAIQEGINAFNVDIFANPYDIQFFLTEADKHSNFYIVPTLDLSTLAADPTKTEADRVTTAGNVIESYVKDYAPSHPSAAMEGNKFVVFIYEPKQIGTSYVTDWQSVQSRLKTDGLNVFLVGDNHVGVQTTSLTSLPNDAQPIADLFDAGWAFSSAGNWLTSPNGGYLGIYSTISKLFAGGIMPGFYRGQKGGVPETPWGVDPKATQYFRDQWSTHLANNLKWISLSTFNDYFEHHDIDISSEWNTTRRDLNAWFSAKHQGTTPPFTTPQLYVTTPQSIYTDQSEPAEALLINPTASAVNISIQLYNPSGSPIGSAVSATVAANSLGVATLNVTAPSPLPSHYFTRAHAQIVSGGSGSVVSAPIIYYPASTPSTAKLALYYSIPAQNALPATAQLSFGSGGASITTSAPVSLRFNEIIHDTQEAYNGLAVPITNQTTLTPLTGGTKADGSPNDLDNRGDNTDYHFYVARVIDQSDRVGYSDPVFH